MIKAMIMGTVTTHVFWRGRDRAAFTYAGVGVVDGLWGEKPVEVLWRFKAPGAQSDPTASTLPISAVAEPASLAFRHGPAPSVGFKQFLAEDGECWLYLMALGGAVDALFPHLTPRATGRTIVKIGISGNPPRRERELNVGFPIGADARWLIRETRKFDTSRAAYEAEGILLQRLADDGRWLNGEFAVVRDQELAGLLGP
ncbi:GIY-YIG nuclease family protein [Methylobacterium sp. J-070]|uniref:GIY-YIG nuclease family protein n=1 Tax=Methylobacterium sp. J-070 TaxID=2836650 RepID=UPI001FB8D2E8|nr:GIY-YIG nuclease family protein [Methylobacterium sp. J-070]MCJ2050286.1 GIY-YIG nuclease family protein [Methylobacterium sp. J-070]